MTTLTKTINHSVSIENNSTLSARYNKFISGIEFNYYGIIAMAILIASCLGGITTMQIFENDSPMWQFMLSVSFTMANLVACIGQAPMKWVVNLFTASLLVNTALLLMNVL